MSTVITIAGRGDSIASPVAARLADLRRQAIDNPADAQQKAWNWFADLGTRRKIADLQTLFALGTAPHELDGPTVGTFLAVGPTKLRFLANSVAATSLRTWQGKSFDLATDTGGNLVSPALARVLKLLRLSADFETRIGPGIPGSASEVLNLDYSRGHRNGRWLGRVIDEVVEIVPDTYLLRGMWRSRRHGLVTLCFVAIRQTSRRIESAQQSTTNP